MISSRKRRDTVRRTASALSHVEGAQYIQCLSRGRRFSISSKKAHCDHSRESDFRGCFIGRISQACSFKRLALKKKAKFWFRTRMSLHPRADLKEAWFGGWASVHLANPLWTRPLVFDQERGAWASVFALVYKCSLLANATGLRFAPRFS
jgi:hypothetical protein